MKTGTKAVGVPVQFVRRDIAEIAVGACVMAFPAATAQEIWDLGEELTVLRVLLFGLASLFFLGVLVFLLHHGPEVPSDRGSSCSECSARTA